MNKNRKAIIDSILKTKWDLKITLTFQNDISEARAAKTLRRWWNEIDRVFYGCAVSRFGKRTERICLYQTGKSDSNPHYHIHANKPADRNISLDKYIKLLEKHWRKLSSANYINEFELNINNVKWANYTTSEITATNTDSLDIYASNFKFVQV